MHRRLMFALAVLGLAVASPAAPARAQAPRPEVFLVFFHPWSAEMDVAARAVVAAAAARAAQSPGMRLDVVGFASTTGSRQANLYLSLLRAQLVSDTLVAAGVAPDRISRIAEGSVNHVDSEEESRRVEIVLRAP